MNTMYEAGTKSMKSSKFKRSTQLFEMTQLLTTAEICQTMRDGKYRPEAGIKFPISERGHLRYITSNSMVDKAVNHVLCDEVITPVTTKYLIHNNGASQKGKGVSFHRREFERSLHRYYMQCGTNDGYILLGDFSGFYANIQHDKCLQVLTTFLERGEMDDETRRTAVAILVQIFQTFEVDVSRFSDEEIADMMAGKVDPMLNADILPRDLPGVKMLRKGVNIGSQPSQNIGILYPYRVDNLAKIIYGLKGYGRYTDDFYAIHKSRDHLREVLAKIEATADEYGLILNKKKTRIVKLSAGFRHLQVWYSLTDTGKVQRKINPKNMTRERRKLKAYRRLLDAGKIDYMTIENAFKSWIGGHWKIMSHHQIYNISNLYFELYGRRPKWKKGHSRLCWLMAHSPKT